MSRCESRFASPATGAIYRCEGPSDHPYKHHGGNLAWSDEQADLGLFREWHDAVYHAYYTNNPRLCGECFVLYGHPECKCKPTEEKEND